MPVALPLATGGRYSCRVSPRIWPRSPAKGVDIGHVTEDVAERGIERNELINSAQPVPRAAVAELLGRYDGVWCG